jgi:CRISPR/Cas system-associated exonuclease Cas4 (RecB family)
MSFAVRSRNLYDPTSDTPFKLSRSKLELFLRCPRCFYLDRRLGIGQPPMPAFTLNSAVDVLLKKEFDLFRARGESHALMREFGIDAVPYSHPSLTDWRDNRRGVQVLHPETNFLVFGSVDDLWIHPSGKISVVDYKSTSINGEVTLEGEWKDAYKRQVEIYQWLLRGNGLTINDTAYFVYVNADKGRERFDAKLEFSMKILSYEGDASWVSDALGEAHTCLERSSPPMSNPDCAWCSYSAAVSQAVKPA